MISVIVPVYNDQDGLNLCVQALNAQTISNDDFEIIVVDNASDPSMALPDIGGLNISSVVCIKPGSYAARNAGIKVASGEILAFLDADCEPSESWLQNIEIFFDGNKRGVLGGGEVKLVKSNSPTAVEIYQCMVGFGQETNIRDNSFSTTANLFVQKSDAELVGCFNEDILSGGDLDWCWRAQSLGLDLVYSQDCIVFTRPRRTFSSAIKQARRVVGGRRWLKANLKEYSYVKDSRISPRRGNLESVFWILGNKDESFVSRLKALGAAMAIKLAQYIESVRLTFGGNPERS